MKDIKYKVKGVDCGSCAVKIEDEAKSIDGVKDIKIDLINSSVSMSLDEDVDEETILKSMNEIADKVEPGSSVYNNTNNASSLSYRVRGLDCASCAAKIEEEAKSIDGVDGIVIDLINSRVNLETDGSVNEDDLVDNLNKIADNIEPGTAIYREHNPNHLIFKVKGLDCASCSAKIETEALQIEGVDSVAIDLVSNRVTVDTKGRTDREVLIQKLNAIADSIEPGTEIYSEEAEIDEESDYNPKVHMGRILVAALLFVISIFMSQGMPQTVVVLIAYVIIGYDIILKAFKGIVRGQVFDENFLMTIATVGALAIGENIEAIAVMLFYQVGEFFQNRALDQSRKSIASLMDIKPDFANLIIGKEIEEVNPDDVKVGDLILIRPGEKVPLDGIVRSGISNLDTTALTGESLLRPVEEGSEVLSGSINTDGVLEVEVTSEFFESTVSQILDLVENASANRAESEQFITKFARYYTPAVVGIAAFIAIVVPLVLEGALSYDYLYRALTFLVISCPCALVISVPLSFSSGIGGASKHGILFKGSNYVEQLAKIDTVVFDKTGTLTKGNFAVSEIITDKDEHEVLKYAALAEFNSTHPIGTSIVKAYGKEINPEDLSEGQEIAHHGVGVKYQGEQIWAGNHKLMELQNIEYQKIESVETIVYVAKGNEFLGTIKVRDEIKEDTKEAIQKLKDMGIKNIAMLTGDNKAIAENVAQEIGIETVYAELYPADKVGLVSELSRDNQVAFVGDGINDAPVITSADIGVAMGGLGSDAAIEAADIVIMDDKPSKLAEAINISKRTLRIVYQNIGFALGVKLLVLVLGAFGLASMWAAIFADVGVSLIAIFNALRLLKVKAL